MHITIPIPTFRGAVRILVPALLTLAVLGALSGGLFYQNRRMAQESVKNRLQTLAAVAARGFDAKDVVAIRGREDMETDAFHRLVKHLQALRTDDPDIRFAYLLRKTAGGSMTQLEFVADADSLATKDELDHNRNGIVDQDEEASYPGDAYNATDAPDLLEGFKKPSVDQEITVDLWGPLISGYAPVKDAAGTTVAVLGIDMRAQDFEKLSWLYFSPIVFGLFLVTAGAIAAYTAYVSHRRWENRRMLETLLKNLPGMAYRRKNDDAQTMEFVSDGSRDLTGYATHAFVGDASVSYAMLIHPSDRRKVQTEVQSALRDRKPYQLTYRIIGASGMEKWVWEQGCGVYAADGDVLFLEGFIMDITEQKRLDVAKAEFLQAASHQLRTPIAAVKWSLSTLAESKEHPLQGMQKELVADAERYVTRMAGTIDMMLEVSELESRQMRPMMRTVPVATVLDEVQLALKGELVKREQKLTVSCPDDLTLLTDAGFLKEILAVLLRNAIVYSPDNATVSVDIRRENSTVTIDVTDHGCGIPEQEQYKVFTRFFRGSNAASHSPEGTGLGLSLVESLVQLLGGRISFVSEENKGSTFTLTLESPVRTPAA